MNIAIIDADLIYRAKHRFPNLACMKLSAYHKSKGHNVHLKTSYDSLDQYDRVFISKVFTDTVVPDGVLDLSNVEYGGTGFFYDKAPKLPDEIEHIKPDYHLYDEWVNEKLNEGAADDESEDDKLERIAKRRKDFVYYLDYSIGFLTRGCFRQCEFCVNKNYKKCEAHSPVLEFIDESRPKLCFLDDNFFACPKWKELITEVKTTGKRFQFKQGLDERLLTDEKIHELMSWPYDGDYIFAFDNIEDKDVIVPKLRRIRELYPTTKKHFKFYVLCGFDRNGKWDEDFWKQDISDTFERIKLLASYSDIPYIMRFEKCYTSEFSGVYSTIAAWCNQPSIFHKFTYRDYCRCKGMGDKNYAKYKRDFDGYIRKVGRKGVAWQYMENLEAIYPDIAEEYFDFPPTDLTPQND
jgi:hypothetical protein